LGGDDSRPERPDDAPGLYSRSQSRWSQGARGRARAREHGSTLAFALGWNYGKCSGAVGDATQRIELRDEAERRQREEQTDLGPPVISEYELFRLQEIAIEVPSASTAEELLFVSEAHHAARVKWSERYRGSPSSARCECLACSALFLARHIKWRAAELVEYDKLQRSGQECQPTSPLPTARKTLLIGN
jgi:hypothetical protein